MRKNKFIPVILLCLPLALFSQSVVISDDGTSTPESSALLTLSSDSAALLLPRMTGAEMEAIATPATGLMVYNTTANIICTYDGTEWLGADGQKAYLEVGDAYQGGIVFEVNADGRSGKIAATADLGKADWGCQGLDITSGNGANSNTDGEANTAAILADCATAGIAARLCDEYVVVEDGVAYDDWYLGARDEIVALYNVHTQVGGFTVSGSDYYYSSTENSGNPDRARRVSFVDGAVTANNKEGTDRWVRPIRKF